MIEGASSTLSPNVTPAPSKLLESVPEPLASVRFLSSISTVVELTVVVVPLTSKSPSIITLPAGPSGLGSILRTPPARVSISFPEIRMLPIVTEDNPVKALSRCTVALTPAGRS
jgi:hypothetical protein